MKKLIVFLCLFFLSIPSWAEYKPIPKELSKQYKAEVEQIINESALYFIARRFNEDVRKLEGALNELLFFYALETVPGTKKYHQSVF